MLVRNVFDKDFLDIVGKSREWADVVIERESIYHVMTAHFRSTCFVAEDHGIMIGYLLGFRSQSHPHQAYMHLVQVDPAIRGHGVGRRMYERFERAAREMGCTELVTTSRPQNKVGMAFYEGVGFKAVETGETIEVEGVRAIKDYNGPGKHIVLWRKNI
jgi:GNAT superfamily N-acetyltransferase